MKNFSFSLFAIIFLCLQSAYVQADWLANTAKMARMLEDLYEDRWDARPLSEKIKDPAPFTNQDGLTLYRWKVETEEKSADSYLAALLQLRLEDGLRAFQVNMDVSLFPSSEKKFMMSSNEKINKFIDRDVETSFFRGLLIKQFTSDLTSALIRELFEEVRTQGEGFSKNAKALLLMSENLWPLIEEKRNIEEKAWSDPITQFPLLTYLVGRVEQAFRKQNTLSFSLPSSDSLKCAAALLKELLEVFKAHSQELLDYYFSRKQNGARARKPSCSNQFNRALTSTFNTKGAMKRVINIDFDVEIDPYLFVTNLLESDELKYLLYLENIEGFDFRVGFSRFQFSDEIQRLMSGEEPIAETSGSKEEKQPNSEGSKKKKMKKKKKIQSKPPPFLANGQPRLPVPPLPELSSDDEESEEVNDGEQGECSTSSSSSAAVVDENPAVTTGLTSTAPEVEAEPPLTTALSLPIEEPSIVSPYKLNNGHKKFIRNVFEENHTEVTYDSFETIWKRIGGQIKKGRTKGSHLSLRHDATGFKAPFFRHHEMPHYGRCFIKYVKEILMAVGFSAT